MKIALCLSGQPRSFEKAHAYLDRNLLSVYDVDVFFHSWKSKDINRQALIYERLHRLYKPIHGFFDTELPKDTNSDMIVPNSSHPANFCTSMFYSIYRANDFRVRHELLTGKKYDFVIRSRFDLALNTIIDFSQLQRKVVYVSKDSEEPSLLNDQFAIADSDTMNVYASTFLNLRQLYDSGTPLCGHEMLQENLLRWNIHISKIDINHPFHDGNFNRGRHSIIRDDMSEWVDIKIWGY